MVLVHATLAFCQKLLESKESFYREKKFKWQLNNLSRKVANKFEKRGGGSLNIFFRKNGDC